MDLCGFEHHGYGSILGGAHTSVHHNLYAHCSSRTPRFNGIRSSPVELVDYRNNVIYNWGSNNVYAGEGGSYNIVNNYYKWGANTETEVRSRILNPYKTNTIPFGKFYLNGNFMDGNEAITSNNWLGVTMEKGTESDAVQSKVLTPFTTMDVATQTANEAFVMVLKNAGAILPARDTLDQRIIGNVQNRTGKIIDVQGGFPHGTPYDISRVAWPHLGSLPPLPDRDNDGMADAWEITHHLNPDDPSDASGFTLRKQITNIELYLDDLAAK